MPTTFFAFCQDPLSGKLIFRVPDTSNYQMIGTHIIKHTQALRYGMSSATQFLKITIRCSVKKLTPHYLDMKDKSKKMMRRQTYVIGD
jgi:hypothetical protein